MRVLKELDSTNSLWAIPWPCLHEFIAIVTHPKIYSPPTPMPIAIKAMNVWISRPNCRMIAEGPGYYETLSKLLADGKIRGHMVHDARVAALCIHHGVRILWSADRDFSLFSALKTENPLA